MPEILYSVKQSDVIIQDKRMHRYLADANLVDERSTRKALNDAYRALHIARGFYEVLNGLGLLNEHNMVGEDIERIEQKIQEIMAERNRKEAIRRH